MTLANQIALSIGSSSPSIIDLLQLIDQDDRPCRVWGNIAGRDLDREPLVRAVVEFLHDSASLCAVFLHVRTIAGQCLDQFRGHAPPAFGRRQHRRADVAMTFGQYVDDSLAVQAQRHRPANIAVVKG
jgi:hypothetical protein